MNNYIPDYQYSTPNTLELVSQGSHNYLSLYIVTQYKLIYAHF